MHILACMCVYNLTALLKVDYLDNCIIDKVGTKTNRCAFKRSIKIIKLKNYKFKFNYKFLGLKGPMHILPCTCVYNLTGLLKCDYLDNCIIYKCKTKTNRCAFKRSIKIIKLKNYKFKFNYKF